MVWISMAALAAQYFTDNTKLYNVYLLSVEDASFPLIPHQFKIYMYIYFYYYFVLPSVRLPSLVTPSSVVSPFCLEGKKRMQKKKLPF